MAATARWHSFAQALQLQKIIFSLVTRWQPRAFAEGDIEDKTELVVNIAGRRSFRHRRHIEFF